MIDELHAKEYYVAVLNGLECANLKSFIHEIANVFRFPNYYGNNINAFLECINDLEWINKHNYALLITNSEVFMSNDTADNKQYLMDLLKNFFRMEKCT